MNTVGRTALPGDKYTVGVAYVAVPSDIDRAAYILDCFRNNQVSLMCEDGAFYNRVPISPDVLNWIEFAEDGRGLGTPVVYATEEIHQQPIVIARLQQGSTLGDGKEHAFKFRRMLDGVLVEINGNSKTAALNLIVDGDKQSGKVNINIFNENKDCILNIDVAGDVNVNATNNTKITQQKSAIIETTDPNGEDKASFSQSSTQNQFNNQKLIVNDGSDPLTLGNELKKFLGDFIEEVGKITTATAIGTQPILNATQILAYKERLDEFLSTVIFTDK